MTMRRIFYWIALAILYPLSLFPFKALYAISDVAFVLVYYVFQYRRKTVSQNLRKSFPGIPANEIHTIAKKFYRNFCDLLVENVKFLTISKPEVINRCTFENPDLLNKLYEEGRSAIMTLGHCGNWELAGLSASIQLKHRYVVFYRTIKNPHFNQLIKNMRGRFGMELIPDSQVRQMMKQPQREPNLYIFITDQTPHQASTSYWTTFLNQDTPVFKGTEKFAKMLKLPVFFAEMKRTQRGYYSIRFITITNDPSATAPDEITETHTQALEAAIASQPDNWLWTHRRWKKNRPVSNS